MFISLFLYIDTDYLYIEFYKSTIDLYKVISNKPKFNNYSYFCLIT